MRYAVLLAVCVGCDVEPGDPGRQDGESEGFDEDGSGSGDPDAGSEESTGDEDAQASEPAPSRAQPGDFVGESCPAAGAMRFCSLDEQTGGTGTQHCGEPEEGDPEATSWSRCAVEHACVPGEARSCTVGTAPCVVLEDDTLDFAECGFTPLAIDLGDDGFAFEPAAGRKFDIVGGGVCLDVDWPVRSTAWLALDRDGDGAILDGRELFGSGTPMPDGIAAPNGFAALATLDNDGDGAITARDRAFAKLVLWSDLDGDRHGTANELVGLAQVGIRSLPLAFDRHRECDARGNCIVERATVSTTDGPRALVDLHLACQ